MSRFESLNKRFSEHALAIRRLQRDDPVFRELCDDFEDAKRASDYWKSSPEQSEERAIQYQELVNELEVEIGKILHSMTS